MDNKPWLKYYPGHVPYSLNYPDWTMYEAIKNAAEQNPEATAYYFLGSRSSYAKLLRDIDHIAAKFSEMGLQKGDRITICMPNTPSGVIAFYAVNKIGAVASMIHPLSTAKEIEYFLKQSESKWALTLDAFYYNFDEILANTSVEKVIISKLPDYLSPLKGFLFKLTKGRKIKKIPSDKPVTYWKDLMAAEATTEVPEGPGPDEMSVILYSGGTTGEPKGIMLSSRNFNALGLQTATMGDMQVGDKMLSILPIFHGFGLAIGFHAIFMSGGTSIMVPKFDAKSVAELIAKEKPQYMAGVPTLYEALLKEPKVKNADFSSFKLMASGGDRLPDTTKKRFDDFLAKRKGKVTLREGYGLTESVTANCLVPDEYYRKGSVGIPFPDMEIKIVELGSTKEVEPGTEGEICVYGPTVMLGYLNAPEENAKTLQQHADGRTWLHTGDLGYMDEDGFLYFVLRMKRIIKVSGMGVYPPQIENTLDSHPDVSMSSAIGVPDEYKMQRVKAFVVLKDDHLDQEKVKKELMDKCKRELNRWSVPSEIEIRESLPLTKIGKVAFTELEKEELAKVES